MDRESLVVNKQVLGSTKLKKNKDYQLLIQVFKSVIGKEVPVILCNLIRQTDVHTFTSYEIKKN